MSDRVAVSVIVPARDAAATLLATLDALTAQLFEGEFEVIVVDNGSLDDTADIAERHRLSPKVIRRKRGEGAGSARNEGARVARGAVLAFTDADCEPTPRWLAEGVRGTSSAEILQGAVLPVPGVDVGPFDRTLAVTSEYGLYETANLFVRREWFDAIGGFEDRLYADDPSSAGDGRVAGRPFGEDALFVWRGKRMGARTSFSVEALVHHAVFPGNARDFIREQVRVRGFPALVARIPELRDAFIWRRYFLNRRTAAFDLAVVGAIVGAIIRSPVPLLAAAPYAVLLLREVRGWRKKGLVAAQLALAIATRDAVGFVSLVLGSIQARTPLL